MKIWKDKRWVEIDKPVSVYSGGAHYGLDPKKFEAVCGEHANDLYVHLPLSDSADDVCQCPECSKP